MRNFWRSSFRSNMRCGVYLQRQHVQTGGWRCYGVPTLTCPCEHLSWLLGRTNSFWIVASHVPVVCGRHVLCRGFTRVCTAVLGLLERIAQSTKIHHGKRGGWQVAIFGGSGNHLLSSANPPSPGCTRSATVTVPLAKRSNSSNARRKLARRNILAMRSRSWSQSSVLMVTQSQSIVDQMMRYVLESGPGPPAPAAESKKLDKVYIRLPWLGPTSAAFKNRLPRTTCEATTTCTPVCVFTTCRMLSTCNKDVLPAVELSNVIYLFNCACAWLRGKASQRLEERIIIRQHVPVSLVGD